MRGLLPKECLQAYLAGSNVFIPLFHSLILNIALVTGGLALKFGLVREVAGGETRVAVVPAGVKALLKVGSEVLVQSGAGAGSSFSDEKYAAEGARIVKDSRPVYAEADVILKIQPPTDDKAKLPRDGGTLVGLLWALSNRSLIEKLNAKKMT